MNSMLPYYRYRNNRMTQEQLANELGVTRITVIRWEKDIGGMTCKNLLKLCEYFGITPNQLLDYEEEK